MLQVFAIIPKASNLIRSYFLKDLLAGCFTDSQLFYVYGLMTTNRFYSGLPAIVADFLLSCNTSISLHELTISAPYLLCCRLRRCIWPVLWLLKRTASVQRFVRAWIKHKITTATTRTE